LIWIGSAICCGFEFVVAFFENGTGILLILCLPSCCEMIFWIRLRFQRPWLEERTGSCITLGRFNRWNLRQLRHSSLWTQIFDAIFLLTKVQYIRLISFKEYSSHISNQRILYSNIHRCFLVDTSSIDC
jgi:hypothetical protein